MTPLRPSSAASGSAPRGRVARGSALGALALAALSLGAGGCAGTLFGPELDPEGRSVTDLRLRRLVSAGNADSALAWLRSEPDRLSGDEVLDHLYFGALTHHAGLYEESSLWLRAAYELAEDRYTRSVSRSALSLVTSDLVLPYEPGETERLLIHYYNAKNHLALGDRDGAAVEARRLSLLLDRYDDDSEPTALRAAFRAFASAVFAAAGEHNDADVAARKSRARGVAPWLETDPGRHPVADDLHEAGPAPSGDDARPAPGRGRVVVVVEHGRIAQRVEETAFLTVDDDRGEHLRHGRRRRTFASLSLAQELAPEAVDDTFLAALTEAREDAEREAAEAREAAREDRQDEDGDAASGEEAPRKAVRESPPTAKADREAAGPTKGTAPVPDAPPAPTGKGAPADSGSAGAVKSAPDAGARPAAPTPEPAGPRLVGQPGQATGGGPPRGGPRRERADEREDDDRLPYVMRVAWATYRPPVRRPVAPGRLLVDGRPGSADRLPLDLSAGVMADEADALPWAIARAVARAGAKLAITRAIEEEAGEKNETVGRILGAVANAGAVLLERADTRSWALVPDRLEIFRIDLPPGEHAISVQPSSGAAIDLGRVFVTEGATALLFASADAGSTR